MTKPDPLHLLTTGRVKRWHIHPGLDQDVGQHSWGVALIILRLHPDPSKELLEAAITHDIHEYDFGDIDGWVKLRYPAIREIEAEAEAEYRKLHNIPLPSLTPMEKAWLKFADQLEAYYFVKSKAVNTSEEREIIGRLVERITTRGEILLNAGFQSVAPYLNLERTQHSHG